MKTLSLSRSIRMLSYAGGCLWASMTLAQTPAPAEALRELNIMSNIFQAAMTDKNNRRMGMGAPQTLYLAGQGMVFTFNLPGGNFWSNSGPGNVFNGDFNFDFDFDFDYDDNDQGPPKVKINGNSNSNNNGNNKNDNSAAADYRRQMQELNNRMHDKQEDMRDQQRKQRELQRAQRGDSSGKTNTADIEKLNKSMEALGKEMTTLGNNLNQLSQEYQSERNAEAEARHKQQTAAIFDTLCKYGNTLQSLKANEHVNVVLHNYGGNKTLVYVLDHDKLTGCKAPDALMKSATSYAMESR